MKKSLVIVLAIATILIAAGIWQSRQTTNMPEPEIEIEKKSVTKNQNSTELKTNDTQNNEEIIDNFEKCVAAGKEVIGEAPHRRCIVNDDLAYIEIETCAAPGGEKINLLEAQRIFDMSQCSREGSAKETHQCDEQNGTLEIDILAYRKNCAAVCVINITSKSAQVDWRCEE